MLIGTAVALNTIVKLADAFFDMLAPDVGQCVFVTAITGVAAVVVANMASRADSVMVTVKRKVLVMVEACRRPLLLRVALKAIADYLLVERVIGFLVA